MAKVASGALSTALAAWTRQLSTLGLYIVVARMLSAEALGVFALATSMLLLVEYAVQDSLSESLVQRSRLECGHVGAIICLGLGAAALVVLSSVAAAPILAAAFEMPDLGQVLPPMAFGTALICATTPFLGRIRRLARLHYHAGVITVAGLTSIAVAVVLLNLGWGLDALLIYYVLEKVMVAAGLVLGAGRLRWAVPATRHFAELRGFILLLAGQRTVFFLRTQFDRVAVGMLFGAAALGAYQLAAKIFESIWTALLPPATKVFFIAFARLQHDAAAVSRAFMTALTCLAAVGVPAFLGLSAIAGPAVLVLFGEGWAESAILLKVMAFAGLPLIFTRLSSTRLTATGEARTVFAIEVATAILGAVLLLSVWPLGLVWIAVAILVRELAAMGMHMVALRHAVASDAPWLRLASVCAGLSVAMYLGLQLFGAGGPSQLSPATMLMISIPSGIVFYLAGLFGLARAPLREALGSLSRLPLR